MSAARREASPDERIAKALEGIDDSLRRFARLLEEAFEIAKREHMAAQDNRWQG